MTLNKNEKKNAILV